MITQSADMNRKYRHVQKCLESNGDSLNRKIRLLKEYSSLFIPSSFSILMEIRGFKYSSFGSLRFMGRTKVYNIPYNSVSSTSFYLMLLLGEFQ